MDRRSPEGVSFREKANQSNLRAETTIKLPTFWRIRRSAGLRSRNGSHQALPLVEAPAKAQLAGSVEAEPCVDP